MLVKEISEQHIQDIGHAFGYYDYGEEKGMASWFRDKEAVVTYICGFVRCVLTDGFLHTTSERGEGYIAYKLPGQKVSFKAARILLRGDAAIHEPGGAVSLCTDALQGRALVGRCAE